MTKESKSKWDQPGRQKAQGLSPAPQFASGAGALDEGHPEHQFAKDIDINEAEDRYTLTKGRTHEEIQQESGAVVRTRGVWYPDRSKATESDPPLHLHVTAATAEALQKAVDKINELI